ncbi:MAG: hypothetical protein NZR01_16790 [Bryobacteraceae bacterium]|nr:hypothetical protein [Bryobacteraceae bacterium]
MKKGVGFLLVILAFGAFLGSLGWALMQPGGLPAARKAIRDTRELDQQVQSIRDMVARKRKHVERLRTDPEERKRAVRQHMNKALPGETTIILPEPSSPAESTADGR